MTTGQSLILGQDQYGGAHTICTNQSPLKSPSSTCQVRWWDEYSSLTANDGTGIIRRLLATPRGDLFGVKGTGYDAIAPCSVMTAEEAQERGANNDFTAGRPSRYTVKAY